MPWAVKYEGLSLLQKVVTMSDVDMKEALPIHLILGASEIARIKIRSSTT